MSDEWSLFTILANNMRIGIFIVCFIVSVGLTALGLMTSYRLKSLEEKPFASSLFYYTIFLAAFGFYSIWSNLIAEFLLNHVISSRDTLINIVGIFPFLGFPLLIVAWYLFIQFSVELVGFKLKPYVSIAYFSVCILLFFFLANYFKNQLIQDEAIKLSLIVKGFAIIHLLVVGVGCILILLRRKKKMEVKKELTVAVIFIPILLAEVALFMVSSHWIIVVLFIVFYYSHPAIIASYLYFKRSSGKPIIDNEFALFCREFEISKRESEIIQEICQGKTNQEIADCLFITIQTVKDHASRIYLKTGVKNRIQLSNLVGEKIKPEPAKSKP